MAQVFAKRFWGFDPARWPVISFGLEGNRDALISASQPGDLIAFIGTQSDPTMPEERGLFLGLAEIGRWPVDTLDVLDPAVLDERSYSTDGSFKWPKSLPMLRAWRFDNPRPRVTAILKQQLSYEATTRAVRLDPEDQAAVLSLPRTEVDLPDVPILRQHRHLSSALANGPTKGPVPTSRTGESSQNADVMTQTYALRFGKRNLWKIGQARDLQSRLSELNKHIPHEVLAEAWTAHGALVHSWPTAELAYQMEQRVLTLLTSKRTHGERMACTVDELTSAWLDALKGIGVSKPA